MTEILHSEDFIPNANNWLLVSEIFKSHQGEGPSSGQVAKFLRLGGCDLHCRWCDTPYTWVFTKRQQKLHDQDRIYDPRHELRRMSLSEIIRNLHGLENELIYSPLIVITGGEPLLQSERLAELIRLMNLGLITYRFEIETAGNITPSVFTQFNNVTFNVSLKLASSGNELEKRYVPEVILHFTGMRSRFKFVITRDNFEEDLHEVRSIVDCFGIFPDRVWLMPEGTTPLDQISGIQLLIPRALELGFNVTSRLHVLAYGNERGV